jgi:CelD/BcsL family acetyltransferase involved in cellulose biosynthesis
MCCPRLCDDAQLHLLSRELGVRKVFRVQDTTRHLDCTGGYEALSARYSTRLQKILKKGWTGLQRQGTVALRVVSVPAERDATFDIFLRLEASGWKGPEGERSSLSDAPTLRAFYRELFTGDTASPEARITLLMVDGVAVAAQLCMESGGTRSLLKIAYDQAQARYSAGSVLLDAVVRDCCASDDLARLSFVTSDRWMDEWGASSVPVGDLWLFRSGITGAAASLVLHVIDTP